MKHKNLKDLYNLHKETKWNAEALRLAIEVIFQRDYYEDFPEAKTRDQMVDHMLLQDDLEDKEDDVKEAAEETGEAQEKLKKMISLQAEKS